MLKKEGVEDITHFRPISLIHGFAKIVAKVLSRRLAPRVNDIVSNAQCAFIKIEASTTASCLFVIMQDGYTGGRSPRYSSSLISKKPLTMYVGITFLRSSNILGSHLASAIGLQPSYPHLPQGYFLNGIPGNPIRHDRGLRQEDPLSPLLLDIAIDPLQRILQVAIDNSLLSHLPEKGARFHTSLYADDAAIFLAPTQDEVSTLARILNNFGSVTGLVTNVGKCIVAPIRCNDLDLAHILCDLPPATTTFPMKYLGLSLMVRRLKRVHFQYLEDKAVARIAPFNGRYFNIAGRLTLVKSVLTSQTIYPLTALHVPVEPLHSVLKFIRSFFWAGTEQASGGKCKVNWMAVCRPTSHGGLGILNMDKFTRALRLRWPWLAWTSPDRPWVSMENPCNKQDMELFYALTSVSIGNGYKPSFWEDSWADGISPKVWYLLSLLSHAKNLVVFTRPSPTMLGFVNLTFRWVFPSNNLKNSPIYGDTPPDSPYMMTLWTLGSSHIADFF
jgi:hypothetical protein